MNVQELIDKLEKVDKTKLVMIYYNRYYHLINDVSEDKHLAKEDSHTLELL